MSAAVWSGKAASRAVRAEVCARVDALADRGAPPSLRVVRVGDDASAAGYARAVLRAARRVGVRAHLDALDADSDTDAVVAHVRDLNADASVQGIVLALPLADGVNDAEVIDAIDPAKDVDRVTASALGELFAGRSALGPATAAAVVELLDFHGEPIEGRRVVIVGRSNVVGKPLAMLLLARHGTVTLCHSRTPCLAGQTSRAEILVAAAGRPGLIGAAHVGPGAVVIDVGTTYAAGKVLGDVDAAAAAERARALTPVPGGVGPLTNYCLMRNLAALAERRVPACETA